MMLQPPATQEKDGPVRVAVDGTYPSMQWKAGPTQDKSE